MFFNDLTYNNVYWFCCIYLSTFSKLHEIDRQYACAKLSFIMLHFLFTTPAILICFLRSFRIFYSRIIVRKYSSMPLMIGKQFIFREFFIKWFVCIFIYIFLHFFTSEDSFLFRLEQSLRAFIMKLNICDTMLKPLPNGNYVMQQKAITCNHSILLDLNRVLIWTEAYMIPL